MRGRTRAAMAVCAIYIGVMPGQVAAQSKPAAPSPPNLAGVWNGTPSGRPLNDGIKIPWVIADLPINERAKAYLNVFDEAISPKYYCQPSTAPAIIADPYHMEIIQQKDRVVLRYEKDDVVRTVWMDGRTPKVQDYSVQGFSVGRYEGNALVVDTSHFVFDINGFDDLAGLPSSSLKRVWNTALKLAIAVTALTR